jgi:hypothetical protein
MSEINCFGKKFGKLLVCRNCSVSSSCEKNSRKVFKAGLENPDTFGIRQLKTYSFQLVEDAIKEAGGEIKFLKLSALMQYHYGWGTRAIDNCIEVLIELDKIEQEVTLDGTVLRIKKEKKGDEKE